MPLDPQYCSSYQNKYKVYSPDVVAVAGVGGNPKSWVDALGYAKTFLAQANGVAYSCSAQAGGGQNRFQFGRNLLRANNTKKGDGQRKPPSAQWQSET